MRMQQRIVVAFIIILQQQASRVCFNIESQCLWCTKRNNDDAAEGLLCYEDWKNIPQELNKIKS